MKRTFSILPHSGRWVPAAVRIFARQQFRHAQNVFNRVSLAQKSPGPFSYPCHVSSHAASIVKEWEGIDKDLQRGKLANILIAAPLLNNVVIDPKQIFSFYACVGNVCKKKGYQPGYQMQGSSLGTGIGGGLCQLASAIFWVMLNAGFRIIERHRHDYDLFPDKDRKLPFGTGASVFYNYRDLRMNNPFPISFRLTAAVAGNQLKVALFSDRKPETSYRVIEKNHRFVRENGIYFRCNDIIRILTISGIESEEFLFSNRCRVMYELA